MYNSMWICEWCRPQLRNGKFKILKKNFSRFQVGCAQICARALTLSSGILEPISFYGHDSTAFLWRKDFLTTFFNRTRKMINSLLSVPKHIDLSSVLWELDMESNNVESEEKRLAEMVISSTEVDDEALIEEGETDREPLILGVDRDNDRIAYLSNDQNISYRRLISMAIKTYKKYGVKVGFCGQQPSDSIDFCNFLINEGIDSISVIPDSAIKIISNIGYTT